MNKKISVLVKQELASFNDAKEAQKYAQMLVNEIYALYQERVVEIVASQKKGQTESVAKTDVAKPQKKVRTEQVEISTLTKAQVKKMNLHFEKYSDKCQLLLGETKPIKDQIKSVGKGHWYAKREGWFLTNKNAEMLAKKLGIKTA